jgi:hypothetical protein
MDPLPWHRIAAAPTIVVALIVYTLARPSTRARATLLGVGMLTAYGMLMDQVSVRLCPEYFTVLHNPIPGLTDPTLLGLAWGFLGAAGGGVAMGYLAGLTATIGRKPPLTTRELIIPMLLLVGGVTMATAVTGAIVAIHAATFEIHLDPLFQKRIPVERHHSLFTVACYHAAAYASAILGSIVLFDWIGRERTRRMRVS